MRGAGDEIDTEREKTRSYSPAGKYNNAQKKEKEKKKGMREMGENERISALS